MITARWSRASLTGIGPGSRDATCPVRCSGHGRRCGSGTRGFAEDGTWDRILSLLMAEADAAGQVDWTVSVDSTINCAHQHATNTRRPEQDTGGDVESHEPWDRGGQQ